MPKLTPAQRFFEPGKLVATNGVSAWIEGRADRWSFILGCFDRHIRCDWGDVDSEDSDTNDRAVLDGYRILSAYEHDSFPKIWIITEADRSVTTILFPEEY